MKNVVIVGGGLAGLVSGIQLAKAGIQCTIIEKKSYPFHRVCGEYISNEVTPFLKRNDIYPAHFNPPEINEFQLSSVTGKLALIPLQMGGFGVSRFSFDYFLSKKALELGVAIIPHTEVTEVRFSGNIFSVATSTQTLNADVVIGSFGKRSKLDVSLRRAFVSRRSPYAAIKYHIRIDHPHNRIDLHNFPGGYCGISNVESGVTNLCYLTHRDNLRKSGSVQKLEEDYLFRNPQLKKIFTKGEFLFEKPEVINEVSFASKKPVEDHILMVGDASGMIAPLCGNGMAMAIRGADIASTLVTEFCAGKISRAELEFLYREQWSMHFRQRLWRGRNLQKLFGNEFLSNVAVNLLMSSHLLAGAIVKSTHGDYF